MRRGIFEKGKFEIVHMGKMTIGRATYEPGWKWSVHVGAATGAKFCQVEHVGMVLSSRSMVKLKKRAMGFEPVNAPE